MAPTPPGIHPDRPERGYVMVRGSWEQIPVITPEARQALWECAQSLNEYLEPESVSDRAQGDHHSEGTPGHDFNQRVTRDELIGLLERHDWRCVHSKNGTDYLRRPGKEGNQWSATLGHVAPNVLYVFSGNASPFSAPRGYDPFGVYARLEHAGDFQAAAKSLTQQGYGQPSAKSFSGYHDGSGDNCPELPDAAKPDEALAAEASLWLDEYIQFSQSWAPRAFDGFHEACALFVLSTAAARRVKIALGPHGVYTSLYQALASRTSLFTKTTTADIALAVLNRAGLSFLLADDDATPQAFLRSLTLRVPDQYPDLPPEDQDQVTLHLAFAAQRGWFYDEWGQHLSAMMQRDGIMAAFRSIIRRLDDHKETFVYSTISRGRDVLHKPYLSLLVNATPADLKPFVKAQSPLWRDGYIARFSFIAPEEGDVNNARFPEGTMSIPPSLLKELRAWHERLGLPVIEIEPARDKKARDLGRYGIRQLRPLPERIYLLPPEVREAFYRYDEALRELLKRHTNQDLDGSYSRFAIKALRIAGILASLHDTSSHAGVAGTIQLRHWYRGQQIAERWRLYLHRLVNQLHADVEPSRQAMVEQRLLTSLKKHGASTVRQLHRWTTLPYATIHEGLESLIKAGVITATSSDQTTRYAYTMGSEET